MRVKLKQKKSGYGERGDIVDVNDYMANIWLAEMSVISMEKPKKVETNEVEEPQKEVDLFDDLPTQIKQSLNDYGIENIQDLRDYKGELTEIKGIGKSSANKIIEIL